MIKQLHQTNEDWYRVKLGDCLLQKPDYGINAAAVEFSDSLPAYLRITDISEDGKILPEKKTSVSHLNSDAYFLNEGDVVFARTGASVGKTYLYNKHDGQLVFAGFLIRARLDLSKLSPGYLYAFTHTEKYWQWVKETSTRSGQPGLNSIEFSSLVFNLPPLSEQNRIVSVLETWDQSIEKMTKKIEIKKQIKKGLMQDLLTGKKRLTGFSDKWETVTLGTVCTMNPKSSELPSVFTYIDLESVEKGVLLKENVINLVNAPSRAQRLLKSGDILFQVVRPYQRNNLFFDRNGSYVASTGYAQIRAKGSALYLYHLLHTDNFVNKVIDRCTGSNYPAINATDLSEIEIKIPTSQEEQTSIAKIIATADKEISKLEQKLYFVKSQKKYLLNNLIVGTIRTPETLSVKS